jgi:hypothetical protein
MNRQMLAQREKVLGPKHPNMLTSHKQHLIACCPSTLDSSAGTSTRKRSRLSRGLAKIGIRSSKHGSA